ncbi:MAG: thioredoxin [Spirochaetes bacterium GWF1_31_7]|nr:MAG: thioredoxin [Spirochaetes bacterium GWE1_32_154]OHD48329.1 MAG: thioredoxin [Spirochaetes bacterium GWE2_31_10]OHD53021.1 MAG: thioredoxin [Spirochaetes bacterium GWF1_31_7]OHD80256.1 MAG: thioredoxin [Spirochaetes bacterium RIFOXYB1_FULL_32_8]HBI37605.1 thioredoxin [Spirochaetia bacterium]
MSYVVLTDDNFDNEVLTSELPVLVDFWAPWCGPCKMIGPIIEELAKEYSGKVKICKCNVDENQSAPAKYGIRSIPSLIVFKDGKEVKQAVGSQPKESIIALFKDYL